MGFDLSISRFSGIKSIPGVLSVWILVLGIFGACNTASDSHEDPRIEFTEKIQGSWLLDSVYMYNPDLGPAFYEDVSEVMVGSNPTVLIFENDEYLIAPGSSRHYLTLAGDYRLNFQGKAAILELRSPGGEFSLPVSMTEGLQLPTILRYEISRLPTNCMKENGLGGTKYIYQYHKLPE